MLNRPLMQIGKPVDVSTIIKAIDDEIDRIYEKEKITSIKANQLDILNFSKVFIKSFEKKNSDLKDSAEKWNNLMVKAGKVGLNENDLLKMVESEV